MRVLCLALLVALAALAASGQDDPYRPGPGEIAVEGKIRMADPGVGLVLMDATAVTTADGKRVVLPEPRPKTVLLSAETLLHVRGEAARKLAPADLKAGLFLLAVGKDLGAGKDLPARLAAAWDRVEGDTYRLGEAEPPATETAAPKPPTQPETVPDFPVALVQ